MQRSSQDSRPAQQREEGGTPSKGGSGGSATGHLPNSGLTSCRYAIKRERTEGWGWRSEPQGTLHSTEDSRAKQTSTRQRKGREGKGWRAAGNAATARLTLTHGLQRQRKTGTESMNEGDVEVTAPLHCRLWTHLLERSRPERESRQERVKGGEGRRQLR